MLKSQKMLTVLAMLFLGIFSKVVAFGEIEQFSPDVEFGTSREITERNKARMDAEREEKVRVDEFKKSSIFDKIKSLKSGKVSFKEAWTGKPDASKVEVAKAKAAFKATSDETRDALFKARPNETVDALLEMHMTPKEIEYQKELAERNVAVNKSEIARKAKSEDVQKKKILEEGDALLKRGKQSIDREVATYQRMVDLDDGSFNGNMLKEYKNEINLYGTKYNELAEKLKNEFLKKPDIDEFQRKLKEMETRLKTQMSKNLDGILAKYQAPSKT